MQTGVQPRHVHLGNRRRGDRIGLRRGQHGGLCAGGLCLAAGLFLSQPVVDDAGQPRRLFGPRNPWPGDLSRPRGGAGDRRPPCRPRRCPASPTRQAPSRRPLPIRPDRCPTESCDRDSPQRSSRSGEWAHAPAVNVPREEIVGTVGAGDAFYAGFLLGVHEGWALPHCLALANALQGAWRHRQMAAAPGASPPRGAPGSAPSTRAA